MNTGYKVWLFMLDYQDEHDGVPPTLEEIQEGVGGLNFRSSAKHAVGRLVAQGRVKIVGDPGSSRRHVAVRREIENDLPQMMVMGDNRL